MKQSQGKKSKMKLQITHDALSPSCYSLTGEGQILNASFFSAHLSE